MLARDPDERFASAAEVVEALTPLATNAALGKLLAQGLEANTLDQPGAIPVMKSSDTLPKKVTARSERPRQPQIASTSRSGGGRLGKWVVAAAAAGALILAGIAYYISTDYGTVLVNSEQDKLKISIRKDDGETKSLDVEQGDGQTKIRSGHYVVEIEGDVNDYEISPKEFDLKRGERQTVKVSLRLPASPPTSPVPHAKTKEAKYDNLTWNQWVAQTSTNLDWNSLQRGFRALSILADAPAKQETAAKIICTAMRTYGGVSLRSTDFGDGGYAGAGGGFGGGGSERTILSRQAVSALLRMDPENILDTILQETREGNRKSRKFAVAFLRMEFEEQLGEPQDFEELRSHILQEFKESPGNFPKSFRPLSEDPFAGRFDEPANENPFGAELGETANENPFGAELPAGDDPFGTPDEPTSEGLFGGDFDEPADVDEPAEDDPFGEPVESADLDPFGTP